MQSPVLVMPRAPGAWSGSAALWVTVAGWASALRRLGYSPTIMTPQGPMEEPACLDATRSAGGPAAGTSRRFVPQPIRQLARDGQRAARMARYRNASATLLPDGVAPGPFVWQHHELFHRAGERLAESAGVPLIEYVHAPIVWEGKRWGVRRLGWASLLEGRGDRPQLLRADLIACVSDEVATEARRLGADPARTIIAPMGVDIEHFSPAVDGAPWRCQLDMLGDFLIGWVGSFRRFHAVDVALEAISLLRQRGIRAGLVLVGDGQDRARLEELASQLGVSEWVHFTGQIANRELPALLASLDAAIVTAAAGQEFHYSPLKVREYLAMALPVVAPSVGELPRVLEDGVNACLYEPGDCNGLATSLTYLSEESNTRASIGAAGRALVARTYSWDAIVERTLGQIGIGHAQV